MGSLPSRQVLKQCVDSSKQLSRPALKSTVWPRDVSAQTGCGLRCYFNLRLEMKSRKLNDVPGFSFGTWA